MARFTLPRDIYHGKGALAALKDFQGKRAVICIGGGSETTLVKVEIDDVLFCYATVTQILHNREQKARFAASANARYDLNKIAVVKAADLVKIIFAYVYFFAHIFTSVLLLLLV